MLSVAGGVLVGKARALSLRAQTPIPSLWVPSPQAPASPMEPPSSGPSWLLVPLPPPNALGAGGQM